jgi:hypothetical protein
MTRAATIRRRFAAMLAMRCQCQLIVVDSRGSSRR